MTWPTKSPWGSSTYPNATPLKFNHPAYHGPSHPHGVGGLFKNVLTDIRDTAYGIPTAAVGIGKSTWDLAHGNPHGFEQMGHDIWQSYKYTYGSGNFHTIMHRIYDHPLGPVLDAVALATTPVYGIGVGVKAVDLAATISERAALRVGGEAAFKSIATSPTRLAIRNAAARFRPGTTFATRKIELPGAPAVYKHYAANPSTRMFQKGFERSGKQLAKILPSAFGDTGKIRRLTDTGIASRALEMERSRHAVGTVSSMSREAKVFTRLTRAGLTPEEIADHLKPEIRKIVVAHAPVVHPTKLLPKSQGYLQTGWTFLNSKEPFIDAPLSAEPEHVAEWLRKYGKKLVVKTNRNGVPQIKNAARDGRGNYLVVHIKTLDDAIKQSAKTNAAVHAFFNTPTKVWKWMVLATAPRYFVNNIFGNALMLAMSADPVATTRGIYHTVRDIHGERVARKSLSVVDRALRSVTGDWIDKWFSGATTGFSHDVLMDGQGLGKATSKLKKGLYPFTHYASDTIPRRIAINYLIKHHPMYRGRYEAARRAGMSSREAHLATAEEISANPAVRSWVTDRVDNILGQYHHYNAVEAGIKKWVPFYGWDRAIMRHAWVMAAERPMEAATFARLGEGGAQETKDFLGDHIPDFLLSSIPMKFLGLGGGSGNRTNVLSTSGLNPYSAIPGITDAVASVVGLGGRPNEAIASQVNPLITGAVEWGTGSSLLTGAPIPKQPGGLFGNVYRSTAEATPLVKLAETLANGPRQAKRDTQGNIRSPLLYKGDIQQQISALLGFPIKEYSPQKAEDLWRRQEGVKKPTAPHYLKPKPYKKKAWGKSAGAQRALHNGPRKPRKPSHRGITGLHLGHKPKRIIPRVNFEQHLHIRTNHI